MSNRYRTGGAFAAVSDSWDEYETTGADAGAIGGPVGIAETGTDADGPDHGHPGDTTVPGPVAGPPGEGTAHRGE